MATITAVLLSGCVQGAKSVPELADAQLSPVGDNGQWFHDEYGNGIQGSYTTENQVCGISDGLIFENVMHEQPISMSVHAYSLSDDALVWERENATCLQHHRLSSELVVREQADGVTNWLLLDAATGEPRYQLEAQGGAQYSVQEYSTPTTTVLSTDANQLVGVSAEGTEWALDIGSRATVFPLANGNIGIQNDLDGWITALEADTGTEVLERTNLDTNDIRWASDGYVLKVNESDPEYAFFDLSGREIDRTDGESQFGFYPRPLSGITFPLEDHLRAGTVVAADASGAPVILTQASGHVLFTREANVDDSEFDYFIPAGLSRNGNFVMFDRQDSFVIADLHGDVVLEQPSLSTRSSVQGGYIVFTEANTTKVWLPVME